MYNQALTGRAFLLRVGFGLPELGRVVAKNPEPRRPCFGDDDDNGLPAYSHQSYSHLVGICHHDEGWEHDTVTFPPCINLYIEDHFEGK